MVDPVLAHEFHEELQALIKKYLAKTKYEDAEDGTLAGSLLGVALSMLAKGYGLDTFQTIKFIAHVSSMILEELSEIKGKKNS